MKNRICRTEKKGCMPFDNKRIRIIITNLQLIDSGSFNHATHGH